MDYDNLLTLKDTAKRLKTTIPSVKQLIEKKYLIAQKSENQWLISSNDLITYIKNYQIMIEPDDHERLTDHILTQQEFADRIGVSKNNIASYKTNRSNMGASVVSLICREFNVNKDWLKKASVKCLHQKVVQMKLKKW